MLRFQAFKSSSTLAIQVFLGLPRHAVPTTVSSSDFFVHKSLFLTCPKHVYKNLYKRYIHVFYDEREAVYLLDYYRFENIYCATRLRSTFSSMVIFFFAIEISKIGSSFTSFYPLFICQHTVITILKKLKRYNANEKDHLHQHNKYNCKSYLFLHFRKQWSTWRLQTSHWIALHFLQITQWIFETLHLS